MVTEEQEKQFNQEAAPAKEAGDVGITPPQEAEKTERLAEKEPSEQPGAVEAKAEQTPAPRRALPRVKTALPQMRDELSLKIEKIMEEGIGDAYGRLSPVAKQEFKLKGEETASKIRELLQSAHVQVKKIFQLILNWLKMLPGINHFFLEQEAKIKTDRIIALKNRER